MSVFNGLVHVRMFFIAVNLFNIAAANCFKVFFNFFRGSLGYKGEYHNADRREDECGEKFVNSEHAAELADNKFPKEYHACAAYHTCDSACLGGTLPEEGEEHEGAECCAKACPSKGNDLENNAVFVKRDYNTDESESKQGNAGNSHNLLVGCILLADALINIL